MPSHERRVGMCFPDQRLFPHLTVRDNIAFSSRASGASQRDARRTADHWLARLDLSEFVTRKPSQLSSGQAQRVALARALAQEPELLCLDEPTAALDADNRGFVRGELRRHLEDVAVPTLIVTHDPLEALMLAQRIVVIEQGAVVQDAPAREIVERPATAYVARLMGLNLYAGIMADGGRVNLSEGGALYAHQPDIPAGTAVLVTLRPNAIVLHRDEPETLSSRNRWVGVVAAVDLLGDRVRVRVEGAPNALVDVTPGAVHDLALAPGEQIWLSAKATEVTVYRVP